MNKIFAFECGSGEFFDGINDSVTPEEVQLFGVYELMMQLKNNVFAKIPVQSVSERQIKRVGCNTIRFSFLEWGKTNSAYDLFFDNEAMIRDNKPNFYVVIEPEVDDPTYHVFNGGYLKQIDDQKRVIISRLFNMETIQETE